MKKMREIKFRAKRNDNGNWVYGQYFKTPLTDENSGTTPDAGWYFLTGEPRHCIAQDGVSFVIYEKTLGQYTGYDDENGKEIYEGDILHGNHYPIGKEDGYVLVIEYGEDRFWAVKTLKSESDVRGISHGMADGLYEFEKSGLKVIGNIYENGETLAS
jgi:uncharacterized phage protein (TIGR01671 family)